MKGVLHVIGIQIHKCVSPALRKDYKCPKAPWKRNMEKGSEEDFEILGIQKGEQGELGIILAERIVFCSVLE